MIRFTLHVFFMLLLSVVCPSTPNICFFNIDILVTCPTSRKLKDVYSACQISAVLKERNSGELKQLTHYCIDSSKSSNTAALTKKEFKEYK